MIEDWDSYLDWKLDRDLKYTTQMPWTTIILLTLTSIRSLPWQSGYFFSIDFSAFCWLVYINMFLICFKYVVYMCSKDRTGAQMSNIGIVKFNSFYRNKTNLPQVNLNYCSRKVNHSTSLQCPMVQSDFLSFH